MQAFYDTILVSYQIYYFTQRHIFVRFLKQTFLSYQKIKSIILEFAKILLIYVESSQREFRY